MSVINEYLKCYLSNKQPYNLQERRYSSLVLAFRDARLITNRDLETGEVTFKIAETLTPANWSGAIIYLIALELIGSSFKLKASKNSKNNAIYNALKNFSSLSDGEARSVESLRHSFAHNYGLINIQRDRKTHEVVKNRTHHFLLKADSKGTVVNERQEYWDGSFDSRNEKNTTTINVWQLGNLVESVFRKLVEENTKCNVDLILNEQIKELEAKYTVII